MLGVGGVILIFLFGLVWFEFELLGTRSNYVASQVVTELFMPLPPLSYTVF